MAVATERASQLLPTVKCSNCAAPVPLNELGEHICQVAPPLPGPPTGVLAHRANSLDLPRPAHSPASASHLLPPRLQGRVGSPGLSPNTQGPTPHLNLHTGPQQPSPTPAHPGQRLAPSSPLGGMRDRSASASASPQLPRSSPLAPRPPDFPPPSPSTPVNQSFQPPDSYVREEEPETYSGGLAGLAGVGRRGFAAAARAAMFALPSAEGYHHPLPPGMQYEADMHKFGTPPLSPASGNSSLHSAGPPSPASPMATPSSLQIAAPPLSSRYSPPNDPASQSSKSSFFDKHKNKVQPLNTPPLLHNSIQSVDSHYSATPLGGNQRQNLPNIPPKRQNSDAPSTPSSVGLAYAQSEDDEDDDIILQGARQLIKSGSTSTAASILRSPTSGSQHPSPRRIQFPDTPKPAMTRKTHDDDDDNSVYSSDDEDELRKRIQSTVTTGSLASRTEKAASKLANAARRSNTLQSPTSPSHALPARSKTTDARSGEAAKREREKAEARKKLKMCTHCDIKIEDGRWVPVDGSRVLCEKCWKNMYLPKCRRCNRPIEKQAVSSSDGQLKGKYHRECFNCSTCQEPFPDKTFYVYDGKPFCAYHYHKANNSLCRAASCGEPVEGPCAVSHNGDRYHPEHLICEYHRCNEQLKEYYEVDGKMLCDKHAHLATHDEDEDEVQDSVDFRRPIPQRKNTRAKKRITQFIDLNSGLR